MIIKSYEVQKNKSNLLKYNFFLLYGENLGLKKDIRKFIKTGIEQGSNNAEILFLYEDEILDDEENYYNLIYTGSLFSNKKIITIYEATDKIIKKISDIYDKYPENVFLIIFSEILEKRSKLRNFFEANKKAICIPCYLDSEKI
jgi:DNA polymerase III, delta subunit